MMRRRSGAAETVAERTLLNLGISEPGDIDVDYIAWELGAEIKYRRLNGCEARIVGVGDRAIIAVDDRNGHRRARFSAGHELGHWQHHRGRLLVCRPDDIGRGGPHGSIHPERVADAYAADLLLPDFMFEPMVAGLRKATFDAIEKLASDFDTSLTATAIKLVEKGPAPSVLICHGRRGREWFRRHPDVPERWFPRDELDPESYAFDVLFGRNLRTRAVKIGADAWFDRRDAARYEIYEQSVRSGEEVLTILTIEDEEMLADA